MKLLLDENLPRRLKQDFHGHDVFTVREMGWGGVKNGELLQKMLDNGFDMLMTFDKNLQHQQNFTKYPVAVFLLVADSNQYVHLTMLSERINSELLSISPGVKVIS